MLGRLGLRLPVRALADCPVGACSVEDMVGEGDRTVVRWTARGTRGALMGVPPTGRQMMVTGISIIRVANGKIIEHRLNWDTLGMLQQLGIVPPIEESGA